ncbi:MAG: CRISPR-associated endonuclease Cas2 [Spirochaetales bacterium]|nr:CRISPR-associated endonuclease Cas2 [Spirochaetales bacterium]
MQNVYHWIISYDIRNVRRLAHAARIIESYAVRVQKSIYEVKTDTNIIHQIQRRLRNVINAEEDYILFVPMCESDWQKIERYGIYGETESENEDYKIL